MLQAPGIHLTQLCNCLVLTVFSSIGNSENSGVVHNYSHAVHPQSELSILELLCCSHSIISLNYFVVFFHILYNCQKLLWN